MAVIVTLTQDHIDAMVEHAREDTPIECCGLLAGNDARVNAIHRAKNAEASPYRFSIDFREQRRIEDLIDEAGDSWLGFYHSHTGSEGRPSPTDVRTMSPFFGPPYFHFLIGLGDPANPEVRVFHIENGGFTEHEYTVAETDGN